MSTVLWLAQHQGDTARIVEDEDFETLKHVPEKLDLLCAELGLRPFSHFVSQDDFDSEEDMLDAEVWHDAQACLSVVEALLQAVPGSETLRQAMPEWLSAEAVSADLELARTRLAEAAAKGHRILFWETC